MKNYEDVIFTPKVDIKKSVDGEKHVYFFANVIYQGVKFSDGSIVACSPLRHKTIFVNSSNVEIEQDLR